MQCLDLLFFDVGPFPCRAVLLIGGSALSCSDAYSAASLDAFVLLVVSCPVKLVTLYGILAQAKLAAPLL